MNDEELAKNIIEVADEVRSIHQDIVAEYGFLGGITKLSERGWKLRKYINITTNDCPQCGLKGETISIPEDANDRLKIMSIQYALPELTSSQRERMLTGMCDVCWAKLMEVENEGTEE